MATLLALERGDPGILLRITRTVIGFLVRSGAHDVRDSWDDLCQEVLFAVIRNGRRGDLRDERAFFAYVIGITRHKLADCLAQNRSTLQWRDPTDRTLESPRPTRDAEILLDVQRALAELDDRHRAVIHAIYIHGYSYEQAADRLSLPLGTLKRRQTVALRTLRTRLAVGPAAGRPPHHSGSLRMSRARPASVSVEKRIGHVGVVRGPVGSD